MLFWGVLDPFLDLKGIKIFFFTNIYVYNYFLGQTKPFATSNRDRLDTPKINLNVHWCWTPAANQKAWLLRLTNQRPACPFLDIDTALAPSAGDDTFCRESCHRQE